jgi:hypothetical protein
VTATAQPSARTQSALALPTEGFLVAPPPNLTHYEGWQQWVAQPTSVAPDKPSPTRWRRMSEDERLRFNLQRFAHHSAFGPIPTPNLTRLHQAMAREVRAAVNQPPGNPRPGIAISGSARLGKSTIVNYFARWYERTMRAEALRLRAELQLPDRWVPVARVTLEGNITIKGLARQLLSFFNGVVPSSRTEAEMTQLVVEHMQNCWTRLVIIDDVHHVEMHRKDHADVNKWLKALQSEVPATFVFVGIELERKSFLSPSKKSEATAKAPVAGRLSLHTLAPFANGKASEKRQWRTLLAYIESELVLMQAPDRMLSGELADTLYDRTQGYIGSLSRLVRMAADLAIQSGEERIDASTLADIKLDAAAEAAAAVQRSQLQASAAR